MKKIVVLLFIFLSTMNSFSQKKENIIDEVIWVIGDEAILRSDIEAMLEEMRVRKMSIPAKPFCELPEQIAMEKLFLHQAMADSLQLDESRVRQRVELDIQKAIDGVGSQKTLEKNLKKPIAQLRREMIERYKKQSLVQQMKMELVKSIEATPAEVRDFYNSTPKDSFPAIPEQVEIQLLSIKPPIPTEEIEKIKAKLRDYTARAKKNPSEFSLLASLYSEDQGSALRGGELGFAGRGKYDPNFADVAYSLQRPNQISRVVKTPYGYHIIQLIERRGDKSNFRHILLRPKASFDVKEKGVKRLDSVADAIRTGKMKFKNAVLRYSDDKDTRMNNGLMMQVNPYTGVLKSHFEYQALPSAISQRAKTMKVGEISEAFTMLDEKTGQEVIAVIKLKSKTPIHKANIKNDYQLLKQIFEEKKKTDFLAQWIIKKQKDTYIHIDPKYSDCDFQHKGWIKK